MRIIFDTNIWISYFIGKLFDELINILLDNKIEVVCSKELIEEIKTVLKRPKFEKIIDKTKVNEIINLIITKCSFYIPNVDLKICRDQKDDFLLKLSDISNADYLITGDGDLLDLKEYKKTRIIKWIDFVTNFYKK